MVNSQLSGDSFARLGTPEASRLWQAYLGTHKLGYFTSYQHLTQKANWLDSKASKNNRLYLLPFHGCIQKQRIQKSCFLWLSKIRFRFICKFYLLTPHSAFLCCPTNTTDNHDLALVEIYRGTDLDFPLCPGLLMSSWLMSRARCQACILGKDHPER